MTEAGTRSLPPVPPAEASSPPVGEVRRITYSGAEALTLRLAGSLRETLGPDLRHSRFVPIPRGGLFVLGMLGYLLDLEPDQIQPTPGAKPGLAVIVDDCAVSGNRLARALDSLAADRIAVAHLLSPEPLRRSVEAAEPRVVRCLAAADLRCRLHPDALSEGFAKRWRRRLPGRRYWVGPTEPIAFPWGAPEEVWWNARDERLETGWYRVSPRDCLRFRAELDLPEPDGPTGPLDLAEGALWKLDGDRLLLRRSDASGRLVGLEGVALDMWRTLIAFGDAERAREHLLGLYAVDERELTEDLAAFLDDLCDRGFLSRRPGAE